jgi:outer membrane protein OmpA-like peptidoglycan-associated protein
MLTLTSRALVTLAVVAQSSPSAAQVATGFALNRFEPSEAGSEWFANDTLDIRGTARPALRILGDYAHKPYILINRDGSENTVIVSNQVFLHLGGSLVLFERLRLGVSVPIAVNQDGSPTGGLVNGQRIVIDAGAGVGDLRAAADLRLAGEYGDAFTLALGARIWFPTGSAQKYLGDDQVRVGPHLSAAGDLGALGYAATLGVIYRANDVPFAGHPTGTEVNFALAAGIRAAEKKLLIGPELFGTTVVTSSDAFFGERTTPLALLGSLHYSPGDFRLGVGAGPGLSHAAGTAAFRALASLEYAPGIAPPPADRDGDSVQDPYDACPDVAGAKTDDPATNGCPADRDKDTVLDFEDACPDAPGTRTGDPKTNGCPLDRDNDTVMDSEDACPDTAGVRTADPKTNGCPSDRDKDAVLDGDDACPDMPGVKTDDPKTNGCPSDRDKDNVLDSADACPDEPGSPNQDPKKNGCPTAYVKGNEIQITEQIKFRYGKGQVDPVSDSTLEAVRKVVQEHSGIPKIRIEGHTDNRGSAELNKRLSEERAAAVANWLVKHGVDRKKVSTAGFGFDRPIDTNDTEEGRANNRRVEFHIEGEGAPKK